MIKKSNLAIQFYQLNQALHYKIIIKLLLNHMSEGLIDSGISYILISTKQ